MRYAQASGQQLEMAIQEESHEDSQMEIHRDDGMGPLQPELEQHEEGSFEEPTGQAGPGDNVSDINKHIVNMMIS